MGAEEFELVDDEYGSEQDDLIDKLPWHLKNKVLAYDDSASEPLSNWQAWKQVPWYLRHAWYWVFGLSLVWTAVVGLIGIICLIVPVVGIPILTFAGLPGASLIALRAKRIEAIKHEQH